MSDTFGLIAARKEEEDRLSKLSPEEYKREQRQRQRAYDKRLKADAEYKERCSKFNMGGDEKVIWAVAVTLTGFTGLGAVITIGLLLWRLHWLKEQKKKIQQPY